MASCSVSTAFEPSRWLKFPNRFEEPDQRRLLWKKVFCFSIPVGSSAFGMCGGIVSTALDFFHSKRLPPNRTTPPSSKDDQPLFEWIKQRQVDSVALWDFWKYLTLMFTNSKRDGIEIAEAWSQIKQDIQEGTPVLIGLERAKVESWYKIHQVANIVKNHQVVVWKFEEKEGKVFLYLYDPTTPERKDITISFNLNSTSGITCSPSNIGPIYAFFKTSYQPKVPLL
jgi:hypothetical protein